MGNNLHWNPETGRMQEGLGLPSDYEPLIAAQIKMAEDLLKMLVDRKADADLITEAEDRIASLRSQMKSVVAHRR